MYIYEPIIPANNYRLDLTLKILMKIKELKESDPLYSDLEDRIDAIKRKKKMYLTFYHVSQLITFIAGGLLTILTALAKLNETKIYQEHVLYISTGITILAAIAGLFSLKEKAMSYDIFLHNLRLLRNEICFDYIEGLYSQNKTKHFLKFQKILNTKSEIIENSYD
jgi:hypothetical protein